MNLPLTNHRRFEFALRFQERTGVAASALVRPSTPFNERIEQRIPGLVFRGNRRPSSDGGWKTTQTKHTNEARMAGHDKRPAVAVRAGPACSKTADDLQRWSTN